MSEYQVIKGKKHYVFEDAKEFNPVTGSDE